MLTKSGGTESISQSQLSSRKEKHHLHHHHNETSNHIDNKEKIEDDDEEEEEEDHLSDAGNQSNDHYKSRLSPFRYKLRSMLLPYIQAETIVLYKLQKALRNPTLDFYFAWTANLASHTFYILMLPPSLWFGASQLARDLIHVLGFGIYFSGFLKDFFCLPRPRSPPLHRITMSSYTTQEYGFPSSHATNATAVTLVLLSKLFELKDQIPSVYFIILLSVLFIYYFSLIFGRLYCGMHGFLDIIVGSIIGIGCFSFRYFVGREWDNLIFNNFLDDKFYITPIILIIGYVSLIHFHSEPIDDCPCFDDSVSFIGVLIGIDMSHYVCVKNGYFLKDFPEGNDPIMIYYSFAKLGIIRSILRFILGVLLVVTWKTISKPVIYTILPPVYKIIGIYLPRRNFISTAFTQNTTRQIRSTSISNDKGQMGDLNTFIKGLTDHAKVDEIGPETDIDYYAMLDYNQKKQQQKKNLNNGNNTNNSSSSGDEGDISTYKSGVFKPRYDVEIVGRLIVYAGISTMSVWGFGLATELVGLS
ncbi:sphingolipid resistance protein [Scheffersomyces coipomensis]|uniref:sphingolipid resistance protein n=1 Tax=Scheffersomyces coipomensis TaxID=1788519 RepID=UPI00315D451B